MTEIIIIFLFPYFVAKRMIATIIIFFFSLFEKKKTLLFSSFFSLVYCGKNINNCCHNPSLGLVAKAKAYKGVRQERTRESHLMLQECMRV